MAEIFRAVSQRPDKSNRLLVIKRILPYISQQPGFEQMFIDEADIAGNLRHENIIRIYDLGKIDDTIFMALEHVAGKDLRQIFDFVRVSGTPIPFAISAYVTAQIARGLDFAHTYRDEKGRSLNIVHRDISPPNLLVSFDGEVKLIDFGIAKATKKINRTKAGILKGKFGYMSPEQVQGMEIDGRSDVFALGIVLWEMLAHKHLFIGDSEYDTLQRIKKANVMIPSTFNPSVPPELDMIVMRALKKDLDRRYASAADFANALEDYLLYHEQGFGREQVANWMLDHFESEAMEADTKKEKALRIDIEKYFRGETESTEEEITPTYKKRLAEAAKEEIVLRRRDPSEYEISDGIHEQDTQPIGSHEGGATYPLEADFEHGIPRTAHSIPGSQANSRPERPVPVAEVVQTTRPSEPQPQTLPEIVEEIPQLSPPESVEVFPASEPEPTVAPAKQPEGSSSESQEVLTARKHETPTEPVKQHQASSSGSAEVLTARKSKTPSAPAKQAQVSSSESGEVLTARKPETPVAQEKSQQIPSSESGEVLTARKPEPQSKPQSTIEIPKEKQQVPASDSGEVLTARKPQTRPPSQTSLPVQRPILKSSSISGEIRTARKMEPKNEVYSARKRPPTQTTHVVEYPEIIEEAPQEPEEKPTRKPEGKTSPEPFELLLSGDATLDETEDLRSVQPETLKESENKAEEWFFSEENSANTPKEPVWDRRKVIEQGENLLFYVGGATLVGLIVFVVWVLFYGTS